MKYTRNEIRVFVLIILLSGSLLFSWVNNDIKEISNTQKFICDIIRENSEYPVDELAEAGCMTEDYLLSL